MSDEKTQIESWTPSEIGDNVFGKLTWKGSHSTKYGNKNAYLIAGMDNKTVKVWGNKQLDKQLQPLPVGTIVSIVYLGLEPMFFADGNPMLDKTTKEQFKQKQYKVTVSEAKSASTTPKTLGEYFR